MTNRDGRSTKFAVCIHNGEHEDTQALMLPETSMAGIGDAGPLDASHAQRWIQHRVLSGAH